MTRAVTTIVRDLAKTAFTLHPAAADRVIVTLRKGVVVSMEVPALDPHSGLRL